MGLMGIEFRKVLLVLVGELVGGSLVVSVDGLVVLSELLGGSGGGSSDLGSLLLAISDVLGELGSHLLVGGEALLGGGLSGTGLLGNGGELGLDLGSESGGLL